MRVLFILLVLGINTKILISQENKPFSYKDDRELFERVVKVEEGLLRVQEILVMGFAQRDKRFEDMNRRLEDMKWYIDRRFNTLYWILGIAFIVIMGVLGLLFRMVWRIERELAYLGNSLKTTTKDYQGSIQKQVHLTS